MMRKIKYALAFLWGAVFGGCVWWLGALWHAEDHPEIIVPLAVVVVSLVAIIIMVLFFFAEHWGDD